jgi:hypothetical protein
MKQMSKKRCREKEVEAILTEKENVDPMICQKLQDVIANHYSLPVYSSSLLKLR